MMTSEEIRANHLSQVKAQIKHSQEAIKKHYLCISMHEKILREYTIKLKDLESAIQKS